MSDKFYFARFLFEIAHVRDNTVLYLREMKMKDGRIPDPGLSSRVVLQGLGSRFAHGSKVA